MSNSSPYFRTFVVGAVWFGAIAFKQIFRDPSRSSSDPASFFIILVVAWVITALLLGVAATHYQRLRSWWSIGLGTVAGTFVVLGLMLLTVEKVHTPAAPPKFESSDKMMAYIAAEATKWVKKDRGIDLDYSLGSIKVIEEELARISKDIDKSNPKQGTFGLATGYGAYIGEVFRRRDGGSWAVDHPAGGQRSYPLTTKSNAVIFPVGWCWKRLINGEEDNVYHKAMLLAEVGSLITNSTTIR